MEFFDKKKIEIYNKIKEGMRLYKIQSLWELPQQTLNNEKGCSQT